MTHVTILAGAVWGIAGAIAMVIVMQVAGGDAPPPFAVFWSRFVGDGDPSDAMPQSLLLHAIYAVVAGAVFVLIFSTFDLGFPITEYIGGIIWGAVWGIVLMVVAAVVWVNGVLDMDPEPSQILTMGVAHVAYGLVLGVLGATVPHLV